MGETGMSLLSKPKIHITSLNFDLPRPLAHVTVATGAGELSGGRCDKKIVSGGGSENPKVRVPPQVDSRNTQRNNYRIRHHPLGLLGFPRVDWVATEPGAFSRFFVPRVWPVWVGGFVGESLAIIISISSRHVPQRPLRLGLFYHAHELLGQQTAGVHTTWEDVITWSGLWHPSVFPSGTFY